MPNLVEMGAVVWKCVKNNKKTDPLLFTDIRGQITGRYHA
jgi:hypothetical protein